MVHVTLSRHAVIAADWYLSATSNSSAVADCLSLRKRTGLCRVPAMGSDNAGKPPRLPRLRARGCTRAVAVALGAAFCATLACASAPDTALHLLAVWLFFLDGIWGTTTANLLMHKQWTFAASRCHSEMPIASWVRGRLESRLTASGPPRQADPVVEQLAGAGRTRLGATPDAPAPRRPWAVRCGSGRRRMSTGAP